MNKSELIEEIVVQLNEKLSELSRYSDDLRNSLESEGKSTAGDKHDTGRAMIHLEQEKLQNQLQELKGQIQRVKTLEKNATPSNSAEYGSFIKTTGPSFLMGIGLGKIEFQNLTTFCVGMETPIGKQIKGLKENDSFNFKGKDERVITVE